MTLVYKKGKTTHLTPEGRHFLGQVLRILDSLDRATESVSSRRELHAKLTVIFSNRHGAGRPRSDFEGVPRIVSDGVNYCRS
jgi:DNA-binding transcriptional LysR family regulator